MFMLSAMTAEANSKSHPSLKVSSSEKSAGLPREYLVFLKMESSENPVKGQSLLSYLLP